MSRGITETLAYMINPACVWPFNATTSAILPTQGLSLTLPNWPTGIYAALYYSPSNGTPVATTIQTSNGGTLKLQLPSFTEDLFVRIVRIHTVLGL